ncbi:LysR family transcriptional regulator [Azospira sp. I13]|uniref:LysR family transcriptional regulator n=1 Tax=Azospira sp. I13 TaxID=1765050 RepID=UPI000D40E7DD|nr:LysR family transcriptional regulator [Azospira sp. I13]GBG00885.1 LysR family transcriptional regulator [Azospira sp. I13]
MDLKRMHYFCTIAEQGQISRAARLLHMAQPPLSQRLKELEEELGAALFHRRGRSLELTEAGQLFYRRARDILRAVEVSREEVVRLSSQAAPAFRIGLSPTCRAPWLARFDALQALFPERQLGLVVGDSSYLERLLDAGQLDVAFMQPPLLPENFTIHRLLTSPTVAVAPRGLLPDDCTALTLDELARHALLLLRRSVGVGSYERLLHLFQEASLTPHVALYSSDASLLWELLDQGFAGLAILPASESGHGGNNYQVLPIDLPLPEYHLSLVCRPGGLAPPLLASLLALWAAS